HLVEANLTGHDSHGVIRIPAYLRMIREGQLVPDAETTVLQDRPAIALLDCGYGFGHAAMRRATELAVEKALGGGGACGGGVRCTHIGRLGEYTTLAASRGVASFVTVAIPSAKAVAPHGGRQPALATNPIAFGFPAPAGETPFTIDMATSVVAEG